METVVYFLKCLDCDSAWQEDVSGTAEFIASIDDDSLLDCFSCPLCSGNSEIAYDEGGAERAFAIQEEGKLADADGNIMEARPSSGPAEAGGFRAGGVL